MLTKYLHAGPNSVIPPHHSIAIRSRRSLILEIASIYNRHILYIKKLDVQQQAEFFDYGLFAIEICQSTERMLFRKIVDAKELSKS